MKKSLRESMLEKRNSLAKDEIIKKSIKIQENLFGLDEFKKSKVVMFYVSFNDEAHTHDMIKESLKSKTIVVPKVANNEIEPSIIIDFDQLIPSGKFGILEPIEAAKINIKNIQVVIVPGIAFDKNGHKLGYGFGYYDKFLAKIPKALKIGLAFDFQIVDKLPIEGHDAPVDLVVTDKEIINIKGLKKII